MDWTIRGSNPGGTHVHTGCAAHPASNSMYTGDHSRGSSGRGVKLIIHLHLVPRLRMSGTKPLLLRYAFMAWTRKTTLLYFTLLYFTLLSKISTSHSSCNHRTGYRCKTAGVLSEVSPKFYACYYKVGISRMSNHI
jgi:hypothetical protein